MIPCGPQERCTAMRVLMRWLHRLAANSASSRAAARAAAMSGAPKRDRRCCAKASTTSSYSTNPISATLTSVDQPKLAVLRNPCTKAWRSLLTKRSGSSSAKTKAPDTAHSPGSAAFEKICSSDRLEKAHHSQIMPRPCCSQHVISPLSSLCRITRPRALKVQSATLPLSVVGPACAFVPSCALRHRQRRDTLLSWSEHSVTRRRPDQGARHVRHP